jgi:glycosyltransferase involved in cell wall biosynthesis
LPKYSIIVPVYNRPQEADELLQSLTQQTFKDFEVLVIEDGSTNRCDKIVDKYRDALNIHYFFKPNSGPGPSRNFGYQHARGDYFVVFDSDCIIPAEYFSIVDQELTQNKIDAWGGPDRAHSNFTLLQRAMGYTMSSVLTTGGIRGGKKRVGWFQPRSFNMGISRKVYEATGGFKFDRFAEDIEFSIRMRNGGFNVVLIAEAYVYHKRRTTFEQFYNQVSNFGKGRALIGKEHPAEVKAAHWFPTMFSIGMIVAVLLLFIYTPLGFLACGCYLLYFMAIFIHALISNGFAVAVLAVPSAFLQLTGYGFGFLREIVRGNAAKGNAVKRDAKGNAAKRDAKGNAARGIQEAQVSPRRRRGAK